MDKVSAPRPLNRGTRALLYATCGLFIVNGVQLLMLSGETSRFFAWTLDPLAAATLGAAFFALAAGQFVAARQQTWAEARVAVPWLWALSGLLLAVTALHTAEFHFSSPDPVPRFAAWLWVGTFSGIALAAALATWLQLRVPGSEPPRRRPLPHALRVAFLLEAVLIGGPGALYLLVPRLFFSGWLYPPSELTLQVTGTGFLSIGILAFFAYRENDLTHVRPIGGLFLVFSLLEFLVLGLNAGTIDWRLPLVLIFVVLLLTLLDPGSHALFGRKVLRLRRRSSQEPAGTGPDGYGGGLQGSSRDGSRPPSVGDRPWFNVWPKGVPKSMDYPDVDVAELMHLAARRYPDRVAFRFFGTPMTYRECSAAIDRFAAGLRKIGVRPGDRVSVMLLSTPHAAIALGGVLQAGCVLVQTSPLYTPRELEPLYNDAGVETVVTLDIFWSTIAAVKSRTKVSRLIVCDVAEFLRTPVRQLYTLQKRRNLRKAGHWPLRIPEEPWVHRFADVAATPAEPSRAVQIDPDDVAVLQYTGGTTGVPKGAMLTHRNLVAAALQGAAWMGGGGEHDRLTSAGAPFHVSGLIGALQLWVRGDENILAPDPRDVRTILKLTERNRATFLAGPPTMYIAMLGRPDFDKYDLSSLRACYATAAALPHQVRTEFERRTGCRVLSMYGLSEACPALGNFLDGDERDGIGIPQSDTDAQIVDAEDPERVLGSGIVGELALRGPQVMKGYWNHPEETARFLRDGWLLTGDLATMDADGYFRIVDRKKDMINVGGSKVYPMEVEDVLFLHPAVSDAAVIGVPDGVSGEAVKAFLVRKPGATVTEQEVVVFCGKRLAPYKVPRRFEFVPELPKTIVGKVLHRELRERERQRAKGAA